MWHRVYMITQVKSTNSTSMTQNFNYRNWMPKHNNIMAQETQSSQLPQLRFLVVKQLIKDIPLIPMRMEGNNTTNGPSRKLNVELPNHLNSFISNLWHDQTNIMGGVHYFITFTNDYNCYTWVYFLKLKSQMCFNLSSFPKLS